MPAIVLNHLVWFVHIVLLVRHATQVQPPVGLCDVWGADPGLSAGA